MRVDAYLKVNQMYQSNKVKKSVSTEKEVGSDTFEMSTVGKDFQIAKQSIANSPDVREDRIKEIKNAMESGSYSVSIKELADKLVNNYFGE